MIVGVVFVILFTVFWTYFLWMDLPSNYISRNGFRRIEYWIEGDRGAQIRLSKQEWNTEKLEKRIEMVPVSSHFLWYCKCISAYLVGSDELIQMIEDGPLTHTSTLIVIFTGVFYFIFVWFREQVCIIACPYGRLQGVLLDNKSINVAYDFVRGEKRKVALNSINKKIELALEKAIV
jgi:polyferredoxin